MWADAARAATLGGVRGSHYPPAIRSLGGYPGPYPMTAPGVAPYPMAVQRSSRYPAGNPAVSRYPYAQVPQGYPTSTTRAPLPARYPVNAARPAPGAYPSTRPPAHPQRVPYPPGMPPGNPPGMPPGFPPAYRLPTYRPPTTITRNTLLTTTSYLTTTAFQWPNEDRFLRRKKRGRKSQEWYIWNPVALFGSVFGKVKETWPGQFPLKSSELKYPRPMRKPKMVPSYFTTRPRY